MLRLEFHRGRQSVRETTLLVLIHHHYGIVLEITSSRRCRGMPEHLGDPCGGDYFCLTCSYNLICTPVVPTTPQSNNGTSNDTTIEVTATCPPPANSTCQMPPQVEPVPSEEL